MAEVFAGTAEDNPDINVAIKVPYADLDQEVRDLFLREAEAARRIAGDKVVRIVDWGDQPPFIAFEFIRGRTLAEEIGSRQTRLPLDFTLDVM